MAMTAALLLLSALALPAAAGCGPNGCVPDSVADLQTVSSFNGFGSRTCSDGSCGPESNAPPRAAGRRNPSCRTGDCGATMLSGGPANVNGDGPPSPCAGGQCGGDGAAANGAAAQGGGGQQGGGGILAAIGNFLRSLFGLA